MKYKVAKSTVFRTMKEILSNWKNNHNVQKFWITHFLLLFLQFERIFWSFKNCRFCNFVFHLKTIFIFSTLCLFDWAQISTDALLAGLGFMFCWIIRNYFLSISWAFWIQKKIFLFCNCHFSKKKNRILIVDLQVFLIWKTSWHNLVNG